MKEKILTLLREMTNDSKSVSYKAEKELCSILTLAIDQLNTIEEKVGLYIRDYPEKIKSINECCWYHKLPKTLDCNDGDFSFKTAWLDINLQEYFETLKKDKIDYIKGTITRMEDSLIKHREEFARIEKLKFEDLNI